MGLHKEVSLTGNVGQMDSQYTDTGKLTCKFSLAVSTGYGDKKETEWYECIAWERTAEILSEYAGKGSKLQVRGDFKLQAYISKKYEEPRAKLVVTVRDFQFLSPKKEAGEVEEDEPDFMRD